MQTTGATADRFLDDYIDWMDAEGLNNRAPD